MLYNTEAIVIRSVQYGETHAILTLLTPSGTVAAMARGAKRPQSRLAASVQICIHGIYTIYQNKGIGNIQQFELLNSHRLLRSSLESAAYAAYFCELVGAAAEDRPNGSAGLYNQFLVALDKLAQGTYHHADIARVWEAKILYAIGVSPNWEVCVRCGASCIESTQYTVREGGFVCSNCCQKMNGFQAGVVRVPAGLPRLLVKMQRVPLERLGRLHFSDEMRAAMNRVLYAQMAEFGGLFLKTRSVLNSLDFS